MNPQPLSTTDAVDPVFFYILGISVFLLVGITATMLWFVVRYHRRRQPQATSQVDRNMLLEIVWTLIPTVLALSMFWYGWKGYMTLQTVPEGAMEVTVTGRMWSWQFEYANGRLSDKLYIPAGQPVKVNIRSADVLHSFYIPAFRVKKDAVPGMTTHVWFVANEPGSYDIFCAEYCGVAHSAMITKVEALPPEEFAAWYAQEAKPAATGGEMSGERLAQAKGCLGCHSLDGTPRVGPTLQGIFGRQVTVERDGQTETLSADENYLREAIRQPGAAITQGFPPAMPAFDLTEEEMAALIDYLKGL